MISNNKVDNISDKGDIEMGELGLPMGESDDDTQPLHQVEVVKRLKQIQFKTNKSDLTDESLEFVPYNCCEIFWIFIGNLVVMAIFLAYAIFLPLYLLSICQPQLIMLFYLIPGLVLRNLHSNHFLSFH